MCFKYAKSLMREGAEMRLFAALHERGTLEIDVKHPVGLLSHVLVVDPDDHCYKIIKRARDDQDFRWALAEMFENMFTAGRITGSQPRQIISSTH